MPSPQAIRMLAQSLLSAQQPRQSVPGQGPASYHVPTGMGEVFQPDTYPAMDVLNQTNQLGPAAQQQQEMPGLRQANQVVGLSMERPIWGQDYLGPESQSDTDLNNYFGATPYEQGRSIPPELLQAMTPEQEEQYGGDQGLQDLTGADPYGNPLPPTWAKRQQKPYPGF